MDEETKDILVRLDNITAEKEDLTNSLANCEARRSDLLRQLQAKEGKVFSRKGVTYTICQRGDTFYTKSASSKKIPVLD